MEQRDVGEVIDELDHEPRFKPQVARPKPRLRLGFVVALLVVMAAGVATILLQRGGEPEPPARAHAVGTNLSGCTALTAEQTIRTTQMSEVGRVTCLAVAGKIAEARGRLEKLPATERSNAIQAVFEVAHPIADAGDDRSAGPIMKLVVEYWPENYMAVFHAGMAEYALGYDSEARLYLERFLGMYMNKDVWRQRAQSALAGIAASTPLDKREAHFPE